jgi:ABC-type uncharacterized transport system permease subunit
VTGVTPELARYIVPGVMVGVFIPALHAIENWLRGVLMMGKATGDIYWGMGLNLLVTALVLGIGVLWQASGVPAAAMALTAGMIAEAIYLLWRARPVQAQLQTASGPLAV